MRTLAEGFLKVFAFIVYFINFMKDQIDLINFKLINLDDFNNKVLEVDELYRGQHA